ncbi:MAG: O-antigen ligase family protein [Elusimicrobia bacterium]|nr:O-antigen ligase family protein [Elusimicrobiota bacterium]
MTAFLLLVIHFVCPLLFFTNFTRNPYQTQITLLQVSVVCLTALAVWKWAFKKQDAVTRGHGDTGTGINISASPRLRVSAFFIFGPLFIFTFFCWFTWGLSWFNHPQFFQPSIFAEGMRVNSFWLVNVVLVIMAGLLTGMMLKNSWENIFSLDMPVLAGGMLFGAGWLIFARLRLPNPAGFVDSAASFLWDPYGFFLWAGALAFFAYRWSKNGAAVLFSINYLVGVLASLYGIGQYFGVDLIWPRSMSPYGNRAISTFGNPNFLSPYLATLMPGLLLGIAMVKKTKDAGLYAFMFLVFQGGLLATLTRSSWAGAVFGSALAFWLWHKKCPQSDRQEFLKARRRMLAAAAAALIMFLLWPSGAQNRSPSAIGRLSEVGEIFKKDPDNPKSAYQPFFQRVLIWSGCWQFVRERPFFGKGWGSLELFYPFYQGELLYTRRFEGLRTHANDGHNALIQVWSQAGAVGMGIYLWFFCAFVFWCFRNLGTIGSVERRIFACGILSGIAAMLVDNILNVSLYFAMPCYLFWWLAGVLVSLYPKNMEYGMLNIGKNKEPPQHSTFYILHSRLPRVVAAGILSIAFVAVGVRLTRYWLSEFYYFRGFVLHREGRFDLALERLLKSHRLFPREVNKDYEIGNVYARLGQVEKALWAYDEALKSNAGYDEIYFNRAVMLAGLGRTKEALNDYLTSLYINPTNRLVYQHLTSSIFLKDPKIYADLAVRVLKRGLHFYGQDKEILNNLGSFYSQMSDPDKAAHYFIEALKVDPRYDLAVRNLNGLIGDFIRQGRRDKAGEIIKELQAVMNLPVAGS